MAIAPDVWSKRSRSDLWVLGQSWLTLLIEGWFEPHLITRRDKNPGGCF